MSARRWLSVLMFAALSITVAAGQDLTHPREMGLPDPGFRRPDPAPFRLELENGLSAYLVPDRSLPILTISAFVSFGTADGLRPGESEAVLRGLRNGPAKMDNFAESLYNIGAEYRVSMSAEETEIRLSVAAEDASFAVDLLAGILRDPATGDPKTVRPEGPPSEASMAKAMALFRDHMLGAHPFGQRPDKEEFEALKRDHIDNFRERLLIPSRTVLAISGNLDETALRAEIQKVFGDWPGTATEGRASFDPIDPPKTPQLVNVQADKLQGWIVIGHELPRVPVEDWAALEIMNYILGGGHFDTRLFRTTRDRRGLTNDDSGFLQPALRGPGLYSFRTYGRPEVIRLLIELTLQEIRKIRTELVSEEELFVAKGALADGNYAMKYEDATATATSFAQEWMRFGDHSRSQSYPSRVQSVTAEAVRNAARKYLHPERMQIVVVGPIDKIEAAPQRENEKQLRDYGTQTRVGAAPGQ